MSLAWLVNDGSFAVHRSPSDTVPCPPPPVDREAPPLETVDPDAPTLPALPRADVPMFAPARPVSRELPGALGVPFVDGDDERGRR